MAKQLLAVLIDNRKVHASKAQKVLTAYGCLIKTRLGIHDGVLDDCSNEGLLICELVGDREKQQELQRNLDKLSGVRAKLVDISFDA
jgi:hypothetical protein